MEEECEESRYAHVSVRFVAGDCISRLDGECALEKLHRCRAITELTFAVVALANKSSTECPSS